MSVNLGMMLSQRAALRPDDEAIVEPAGRWSFREFDARCARLAAYLQQQGVGAGDRVAILAKNGEFVATAFFAAAKVGAIAVILNHRLALPEWRYILDDSEPVALLFQSGFADAVRELLGTRAVPTVICQGVGEGIVACARYEDIVQGSVDVMLRPIELGGAASAALMYTSGTTGKPKGALLSHEALVWSAQSNLCTLKWNQDARFLLVAPVFHIGGLAPLMANVIKGCTTVFLPDFDPVQVWQSIAQERITAMMTVPVMLQAMLKVAQQMPVDASSLDYVSCGASVVPAPLIQAMQDLGVSVAQVYGITEVSGPVSYWLPTMGLHKCDTHGHPAMFVQVRIVDPVSLEAVASGEAGEILCQTPALFSGYWRNPQASELAMHQGWYRTGDIGRIDSEGFLQVVDRLKDMIISGGENVYPAELEAVLSTHPEIAEVAVVGAADATWGEVPVAFVVRAGNSQLTQDQVTTFCRVHMAGFKVVKQVQFVERLPRSPVGKVLKAQLRS